MTELESSVRRRWPCFGSVPDLFPRRLERGTCSLHYEAYRREQPAAQNVGVHYVIDCGVFAAENSRASLDSLAIEENLGSMPFASRAQCGSSELLCAGRLTEQIPSNRILEQQEDCNAKPKVTGLPLTDTAGACLTTFELQGGPSGDIALKPYGEFSYFSSGFVLGKEDACATLDAATGSCTQKFTTPGSLCKQDDSLLIANEARLGSFESGQFRCDLAADAFQAITESEKRQLLIRELFESYFSDRRIWGLIQNLSSRAISHSGWCSIIPVTQFAKVRAISTSMFTITQAIRQSTTLQLSNDGKRVYRIDRPSLLVAIARARSWRNTVYMLGIPKWAHEREIARHFSGFGRIVAVTLCPSTTDAPSIGLVEFFNREMASSCIAQGKCYFKGNLVEIVSRRTTKRKVDQPLATRIPYCQQFASHSIQLNTSISTQIQGCNQTQLQASV